MPPLSGGGTKAGVAGGGGGGTGGGWSTTGSTQPGAGACAAVTAAAPAAHTAVADAGVDMALSATHGLIDCVEAGVAALATVELKHNAQPNTAPRICVEGLESITATFLNTGGKLDSERACAKPHPR